jgi:hypothetical protein
MKFSRRVAWVLLLLGAILFLGLLFRDFIVANVITPIGMLFLLFWRLIISVSQVVYWGIVITFAVGLAFYHLFRLLGREADEPPAPASDSILETIGYWRHSLEMGKDEGSTLTSLKSELRRMLVAMYAAKQPETAPFLIFEALRLHQLPLPNRLHAFLFSDEPKNKKLSWKGRLLQLAAAPEQWLRHWTGRDIAEYYQVVEETLSFMEELQEIKHGDDYFGPPTH